MEILKQLLQNDVMVCGCMAWFVAQVLKAIIYAIINKKFLIERMFGDGGMPSGHSATVCAMAVCAGIVYGLSSFQFAIATMVAIIVMHDAMGVRRETGKQAEIIKEMASIMEELGKDISDDEKLKVFVGHTPIQVMAGALVGIIVALFWLL